jgi:FtsH-binding integral membrane protein
MRRAATGALVALGAFFGLVALGAVAATAGTGTLDGRATAWELVCLVAGLVAGFAGSRAAAAAPRPARYAAAIAGPALLALVFALTTDARDADRLWIAFLAAVAGAAAGAALREALGAAQRRG